jgi:hypothetical protein
MVHLHRPVAGVPTRSTLRRSPPPLTLDAAAVVSRGVQGRHRPWPPPSSTTPTPPSPSSTSNQNRGHRRLRIHFSTTAHLVWLLHNGLRCPDGGPAAPSRSRCAPLPTPTPSMFPPTHSPDPLHIMFDGFCLLSIVGAAYSSKSETNRS